MKGFGCNGDEVWEKDVCPQYQTLPTEPNFLASVAVIPDGVVPDKFHSVGLASCALSVQVSRTCLLCSHRWTSHVIQ